MGLATRLLTVVVCLSFAGLGGADDGRAPAKTDDIKLLPIKAADIEKVIAAHKGKVIVLDVWAEF